MIVILDNYDSFTYNLYQMIAATGVAVQVFRNDKISVEEIRALPLQGIILSPGPGRPEKAGISVALIQALAPTIPILGVCLGHQAIAIAFHSRVIPANEIVHGKATPVFHHHRHLFNHIPSPFNAGRYHSLIVEKSSLSDELIIEAENDAGIIMAIKHKTYPCYGIQFHPESILTPHGQQFLNNFVDSVC